MAAGAFLTHDTGLKELLDGSTVDWVNASIAAVLLADTYTQDRAAHDEYQDISGNEIADADYSQQQISGKAVSVSGTQVQFTHSKINFGASVTITAKYLAYVVGTAGSLGTTARVLGIVDLNSGGGSVSSVSGEFSFTPDATNGLFEANRSAAP